MKKFMVHNSVVQQTTAIILLTVLSFCCKKEATVQPPTQVDTTSHAISWQVDTLGVGGSSLYDVAIINDTLAYVVGEMYLKDSTGQIDPIRYNLAIWNGVSWSIRRVPYHFQGNLFYHPIQAVFAFNANNIWFCGNGVIRWNGLQFIEMPLPPNVWGSSRMDKIWGSSSSDLYVVGDGGSMAHYNGTSWQRVESGTSLNINDIWGSPAGQNGAQTILCVASNGDPNLGSKILQINGTIVTSLNTSGLSWDVNGIWFMPEQCYYIVGAGVHKKVVLSEAQWYRFPPGAATSFSSSGVRGNAVNDIFVVGSFGEVVHYNGLTWKSYFPSSSRVFGRVSVKKNLVVAVGFDGTGATALIGRR